MWTSDTKDRCLERQQSRRQSLNLDHPSFGMDLEESVLQNTSQSSNLSPLYNIILLGKTGVGKSACGNTILKKNAFVSKKSFKPVTQQVQRDSVTFDGETLHVYDTPGVYDREKRKENLKQLESLLQHDETVCTVVLLVVKADRLSPEDEEAVNLIEDFIPERLIRNSWILFTRGDDLERDDLTIEEFIEDTDKLKRIVQRFENRYHVFNNSSPSPDQVRSLITKIKSSAQLITPNMSFTSGSVRDLVHRRIVLVGKSGSGKSATGNTILGEKRFRSEISYNSVTSKSEMQEAVVAGTYVSVIDTPGIFDTKTKNREELAMEIGRSIYHSAPGPHAFLYVLPVNTRFTEQEGNVIDEVEMIFGKDMNKYTIILFTYGDLLEGESINIESDIQNNKSLSKVMDQCGGRYHIFNNKDRRGKHQVTELLQKIDTVVEQNGGSNYTNEMLKDAERFRQDEEKKQNKQGFEAFYRKYKNILLAGLIGGGGAGGAIAGATVGAIIGVCVGGPIGVGIGAGVGAGLGAGIGAGIGTLTGTGIGAGIRKKKKEKKERQGGQRTNTGNTHDEDDRESTSNVAETQDPEHSSEATYLLDSSSRKVKNLFKKKKNKTQT